MERSIAGFAVVCVAAAATAIILTPVHVAQQRGVGLIGRPLTYRETQAMSEMHRPFDIATIEFEQQPGIRGRLTLSWKPDDMRFRSGFVMTMKPLSSRSGWKLEQGTRTIGTTPVSYESLRLEDLYPSEKRRFPIGGLAFDSKTSMILVLIGDSRHDSLRFWTLPCDFFATSHRGLGMRVPQPPSGWGSLTRIPLPEHGHGRLCISKVTIHDGQSTIDLVPWIAGIPRTKGAKPVCRVTLSRDFGEVLAVDVLETASTREESETPASVSPHSYPSSAS